MNARIEGNKLIIENEAAFFKELINLVPASVHIMKLNGAGNTLPIWMNDQYAKILGYNFEERQNIGINFKKDELYHPDDFNIVRNGIKKLVDGKADCYAGMFRAKHKDGNWKWLLSSARMITINGYPDYLLSVLVDLSEKMPDYNFLVERYLKEISQLKNLLKLNKLTKTEKEIINLLAQGLTTCEIAQKRNRSYETINNHKRNIFKKLALHNSSELVAFAIANGLG